MLQIAARITKVDRKRRLVSGTAVAEEVDRSGEVFDYESSKPNFERWSAEVHKDSGGQSLGNIREMHGNVAAGRIEDLEFDDEAKCINITAKIVDDSTWEKIEAGMLTGFSIGGQYERKWADELGGRKVTRYTANPSEVSIVDRPAVPSAKITELQKFRRGLRKHLQADSPAQAALYRAIFGAQIQQRANLGRLDELRARESIAGHGARHELAFRFAATRHALAHELTAHQTDAVMSEQFKRLRAQARGQHHLSAVRF